ncbi:glycosyltransferase family 4 protein [Kutzneria kofuensis]|uniref:Phosphatidylinositol alpha-1,6-mannosyltransferase n=1 Tax=Kutzneria kofuensis TaxID=103725 RepID=A0A7W9NFW0_9PSEU|nr:glycosyltransferase family 4 protein [Kutzneria kofuensis]MBB5890453.1 phosphatidylinositol alpha-1,6-mannosyltransferase [Kutzneria kofuensis]
MRRTLLVTNDFPPRPGGIQYYLHALANLLGGDLVVYAPAWSGSEAFDGRQPFQVVRHPDPLLLPTPDVQRRVTAVLRGERCDAVWFGAAAPLGLLGPHLPVDHIIASSHGHEVGWSMLPGARQALRRIGDTADVVTFVSRFTRSRIAPAFGPRAALEHLPAGVDINVFKPDAAAREFIRARHGLSDRPVIVCVSRLVRRKGQDDLIRAMPKIRERVPDATLLLVGDGPDGGRLSTLADAVGRSVVFVGEVHAEELPAYYAAGDVFAMPCRTLARGLDVEGLGLVYLEAAATGLPVIAGNAGGAPETVREGVTGHVVERSGLATVLGDLLLNRDLAAKMGAAGREWTATSWRWDDRATKLAALIDGRRPPSP